MAPRFFTFGSPSVVAEGERTHTKRGNHTQTQFTNNKYATVHRHVLDLSAWRARAVQCLCEHTGRGGVKLKAESWAECGAVACGRWRRRAATRHGHRHESTARDLGQEDAYSTFWSDTDRNRDSQDTAGPGSRFLNVHGKSGGPVTAVSQFLK